MLRACSRSRSLQSSVGKFHPKRMLQSSTEFHNVAVICLSNKFVEFLDGVYMSNFDILISVSVYFCDWSVQSKENWAFRGYFVAFRAHSLGHQNRGNGAI